ncbi:hypothetical protein PNEG_03284 [Pneumocystis murina B123]|uniref:NADH dehydrogenase [ubiquinone] 1 beta subcomplex subunit 9 n=1 Tax=Pneumocystis murina (strain B123) TaxID=1069680 RepID=M7PDC0_PNEMU|nr:hypothetical protein PNEG_03284 [Pneumocystis murina B123]EMR08454.1 hypothetical protein PNEG_03284 [Pneumocystis murina B123]
MYRSRALSLYRRSLKLSLDWCVRRDIWRLEALKIRSRFESNKNIHDPRLLLAIFDETEEILKKYRHPDPYIVPTSPGGSKWERNILPSAHVSNL